MRPIVGLRHDVDTLLGLSKGVPLVMEIERQVGVRSSLYVRVVLLEKDEACIDILRSAQEEGWEIGLHLDNTYNREAARSELERLRSLGFDVKGVTIHGGLYGMMGKHTWRVIESLGLAYANAGDPPNWVKTPVIPGYHTLDYYVGRHGETEGLRKLLCEIIRDLKLRKSSVISSHPEYFIVSTGVQPVLESRLSLKSWIFKMIRKASIAALTGLGVRKIGKVYGHLLALLRRHVDLVPLISVCKVLYDSCG